MTTLAVIYNCIAILILVVPPLGMLLTSKRRA